MSAMHARGTRPALWMFDFDNTLAPLEPAVDWAGSRRELQAWLAAHGVAPALFAEFPRGNLVLYEALRARLSAGGEVASAVLVTVRPTDAANHDASAIGAAARADAAARIGGAAPVNDAARRALIEGASAIIERYELAGVGAVAPAPGALELLHALNAAGSAIAVVTSNSSRTIAAWLKAHRAETMVRAIIGRDSGLALKPCPATLERALKLCAAAPADAAFVGDSEADFTAAATAGVRFYGVNAKPDGRDRLMALGAAVIFPSLVALATHLNLPALEGSRSDL
jgi:phosphoglycolate phosphatase-like HAD superfamily hydrolase